MFAFNAFGGGAPAPSGGVLGTSAPNMPVFGSPNSTSIRSSSGSSNGNAAPPVFGGVLSNSQGLATPLSAAPVFAGSSSGSHNSGNRSEHFTFVEPNAQGILSQSTGGANMRRSGGTTSSSSSGTATALPPPPNYAAALPASSTPVFGGPGNFASTSGSVNHNNKSSNRGGPAATTAQHQSAPSLPAGHHPGSTSSAGGNNNPVFGQQAALPFQRSTAPAPPAEHPPAFGSSEQFAAGRRPFAPPSGPAPSPSQQRPHHQKFGSAMPPPTTTAPAAAPAATASTAGAGASFGVLGSDARGRSSVPPPPFNSLSPTSSGAHPVFGASPFAAHTAAAAASTAPSAPPPPLSANSGVLSREASTKSTATSAPNPFSSVSSSFSAPFGRTPAAAATATAAAAPPPATTPAPPPPPASTAAAAVLRATPQTEQGGGAAPLKSAFGVASPLAPSAFSGSTTQQQQQQQQQPQSSVTPSVFSSLSAPSSATKPSVFGADASARLTGEGKAQTGAPVAPPAPAASVFASLAETATAAPPPAAAVKSAFGTSFHNPAAPPPPSSVFAASSVSPAPGGGGGGGGRRDAVDSKAGNGDRGRRRGRSPTAQSSTAPPHPRSEAPSFSIPAPRHVQQQQQHQQQQQQQRAPTIVSRTEKLSIPSLPTEERQWSLAARVCKSFLLQLASPAALGGSSSGNDNASREVGAAEALEQAFFGAAVREGVSGNFATTAGEMLAVWQTHVRPAVSGGHNKSGSSLPFPGETWVAVFALGTYINVIVSTLTSSSTSALPSTRADLAAYKAGLADHPSEAFTDACHYANELSELLQTLVQRGGEAEAPPYSVIPVVLRRVRTVFDEANARGVATVQSNLSAVTLKLFAVLNRRVKATAAVLPGSGANGFPADKSGRWLLMSDSKDKESLLHSFAYLVCEMIAVDAPMNDDVEHFVAAFHECLSSALAERCMLYYRRACALLRQPLRMQQVGEAAELLAKALAVYPPEAPPHNRRVLEVKLLTAELALGKLPPDQDRLALDVPQLVDVVNALRTSRLDLLDAALRMHGPYFVRSGVHNILMLARQRIALLMVVKFYVTHGCEKQLRVMDMVRYHRLPYSCAEAATVWLLPLLVEKYMNGVLDHEYLLLSAKTPFDEYPRELLLDAANI